MKALEKDRRRRYETANDFAADLMRYLTDQPVEACTPSAWYRFSKYARRNRVPLMTSALVAVALLVGLTVSLWQAIRATRAERNTAAALAQAREQRGEAHRKSAEAEAVVDFLVTDMIGAASPERTRGRTTTVQEVLAHVDQLIDGRFAGQPLMEAAVRHAMGAAYLSLRRFDKGELHVNRAIEIRTKLLGREHPDTLESMIQLAGAKDFQGYGDPQGFEDARVLSQSVLHARRRILGPDHPLTLAAETLLAYNLRNLGRFEESQVLFERACASRARVLGPEARETLEAQNGFARLLYMRGNLDEAEVLFRRTVDAFRRPGEEHYPRALQAIGEFVDVLIDQGKLGEADVLCNELLQGWDQLYGPDNGNSFGTLGSWIRVLRLQGRLDEARVLFNQRLARLDALPVGPDPYQREQRAIRLHWLVRWMVTNAETASIDPAACVRAAEMAVELRPRFSRSWNTLGVAYYRAGDWKAATAALQKAEALAPEKNLAFNGFFLAMAHWRMDQKDEARKWYDQAVRWMDKNKPQDEELRRFRAEAEQMLKDEPDDTDRG